MANIPVSSGHTSTGVVVASGDTLDVMSGGTADFTSVTSGGTQQVDFGGLASGTVVSSGGSDIVFGTDSAASVNAGGVLVVNGGGRTVSASLVGSASSGGGAVEVVRAGGTASATTLSASAVLVVSSGGLATDSVVDSRTGNANGGMVLSAGGAAIRTTVNSGGVEFVSSGGADTGASVTEGGFLVVRDGKTVGALLVGSDTSGGGGHEIVSSGGTALFTTLSASAQLVVSSGGTAVETFVNSRTGNFNGGMTLIGGTAYGTNINSGGVEFVSSGGTEVYAQVLSGGALEVLSGGASYFAALTGISGSVPGDEFLLAGGNTYETTVTSGGILILSGGNAFNSLIQGFGGMIVSAGAVASGVDMTGGFNNLRGGTESGVFLANGGFLNISGGIAIATVVEGNGFTSGTMTVSAGGSASQVLIAGGLVEVQSGGVISGPINFAGTGGKLKIDTTTSGLMLSNTINGFVSGNTVDLTSVTFSAGAIATLVSGDVLQVTNGGKTYDLQLSTSQNFTGETFSAASDGASGTMITAVQPISISGATVGAVQKDTFTAVSGILSATDSTGSAVTWSVVSGTTPHAPSYQFAIDQFQVVAGGSAEFTDNFSSTPPPNFSDGQSAQYTVSGGTLSNNGSQDLLLGSNAGVVNASNGTDGQVAYLNTDTSAGNPTNGLFSGTSFAVKGTFDLVIPTDAHTGYGIALSDRAAGDGHDVVRLEVTRNIYNQVQVQLQQINNVTGSTDFVQSINLNPAAGDNRIELQLSNNGAVNNGSVTASFTLLNNATVDSTTNFTLTGTIFAPENGVAENWTQASFLGLAPKVSDSSLAGTYGTLDIEQNGTWAYGLNNSLPAVQALTQQQFVTDSFQVQAADGNGNSTTTPVTVLVAGDSPTLSVTISGTPGQGLAANGTQRFNQFLAFGDSGIDSGYFFTHNISNNPTIETQYQAAQAAGGGLPTSLGGAMNSTLLAQDFGLTAIPLGEAGGTNYAASGATVRGSLSGSLAPSINSQVQSYLSSNGFAADPNALYLVDGGGNDEKIALTLAPVAAQSYMIESANQLANDLTRLYLAGAKYIVVKDNGRGGTAGSLGALFNSTLQQDLAAVGVPIILEDYSTLISAIDANQAAYGITNAAAPPAGPFTGSNAYNPVDGGADLNPNPAVFNKGWSLYATQLTSPNAGQTHLWSDDEHLSAAGQAIEANYIYNLIQNAVPTVGETLSASPSLIGSNGSTANIVYQWQSQLGQSGWTNISGANGSTYLVKTADLGANLRVQASFTDPATGLQVSANSPATLGVAAAALTWIAGASGDWSNALDWTGGVVPTSTNNVVLSNLSTSPNTVGITISSSQSAQSLTLNDAGTTVVASGGTLTLAGALTIDAGGFYLQNGGSVNAAGGIFVEGASPGQGSGGVLKVKDGASLSPGASVTDNGIVDYKISGFNSFIGSLSGRGMLVVEGGGHLQLSGNDTYLGGTTVSGSTLELVNSKAAGTGVITLAAGNPATLQIDGAAPTDMPANTIAGFMPGDTFDLAGVNYDGAGHANLVGNVLQISENGSTYDLKLAGAFSGEFFHLAKDGGGTGIGTAVTVDSTPCYCRGTLILTPDGEVAVEELSIGDLVTTMSGAARQIRWIGRRSYSGRFVLGQKQILPICIKAGALDEDVPRRDLWISPHHAMYLEGVLIEAKDLVNGVSVVQADRVEKVEYFHIELESHDVIVAEGSLSETFIDDDDRGMFHNAAEYQSLYPEQQYVAARYFAPRCDSGYEVEAARQRIERRAGLRPAADEPGPLTLRGYVDKFGPHTIEGWAQDIEFPEVPVCLDIYVGGQLIGRTLANRFREDLQRAGLGSGKHSFVFAPPSGSEVALDRVEVRRSRDGAALGWAA